MPFPSDRSAEKRNIVRREKRAFHAVRTKFRDDGRVITDSANSPQQLLNLIPGFVWQTDENGLYTYFNQSWLEFRGRSAEDEKGLGWIEGIHPDDLKWALDVHAEAAAKKLPFARQFRLMGGDRQYHWIRDAGRPILENGILTGYCGTATDHTAETLSAQALRDALDQKETLFQEAHHRIKNNLQILSSLLHLQAQQVQDETVRTILEDCQKRVSVIVLLHQKLFLNELSDQLNFSEYVKDLVAAISRSYGNDRERIKIQLETEPISLHVDKVIACGLIITELISNSFKHAFPNGGNGQVLLRFHTDHSDYVLEISDGGIGMKKPDLSNSRSLGLKLVSALISQLGGSFQLKQQGGTKFTIRFPR